MNCPESWWYGRLHNNFVLYFLQHSSSISEEATQFYIACVVEALEYLHEHDVVYRDIKVCTWSHPDPPSRSPLHSCRLLPPLATVGLQVKLGLHLVAVGSQARPLTGFPAFPVTMPPCTSALQCYCAWNITGCGSLNEFYSHLCLL